MCFYLLKDEVFWSQAHLRLLTHQKELLFFFWGPLYSYFALMFPTQLGPLANWSSKLSVEVVKLLKVWIPRKKDYFASRHLKLNLHVVTCDDIPPPLTPLRRIPPKLIPLKNGLLDSWAFRSTCITLSKWFKFNDRYLLLLVLHDVLMSVAFSKWLDFCKLSIIFKLEICVSLCISSEFCKDYFLVAQRTSLLDISTFWYTMHEEVQFWNLFLCTNGHFFHCRSDKKRAALLVLCFMTPGMLNP